MISDSNDILVVCDPAAGRFGLTERRSWFICNHFVNYLCRVVLLQAFGVLQMTLPWSCEGSCDMDYWEIMHTELEAQHLVVHVPEHLSFNSLQFRCGLCTEKQSQFTHSLVGIVPVCARKQWHASRPWLGKLITVMRMVLPSA
jgi:hypothetical protein